MDENIMYTTFFNNNYRYKNITLDYRQIRYAAE